MTSDLVVASCGLGMLDGAVWRPGDGLKHIGPPWFLDIGLQTALFRTRCGLGASAGDWRPAAPSEDDDCWCHGCLDQAGIPHVTEVI